MGMGCRLIVCLVVDGLVLVMWIWSVLVISTDREYRRGYNREVLWIHAALETYLDELMSLCDVPGGTLARVLT